MSDKTIPVRPTRKSQQPSLFDVAPKSDSYWWGMPAFSMVDQQPERTIKLNFASHDDVEEFARRTGLHITSKADSLWFPQQRPLNGEWYYDGPKVGARYPVCIPSKGRARCQTTSRLLDRLGVNYRFFVEETEADQYIEALGRDRVVVMPFHDLGQGSVPARNFIWETARAEGHARHWVLDDNITGFARCHNNRRLVVRGGGFFRAIEDFADRYENIALAGPHGKGFVSDRKGSQAPVHWNSRVYSCTLIDTSLPERWRGRYNEDTDLSLRLLKRGLCTVLFRSLLMQKAITHGAKGRAMPGGNTDNVYNTGDHRLAFAQALSDAHPDVVSVKWLYNRWHHYVDYKPFAGNRPILRPGVVPVASSDDYGMRLTRADAESMVDDACGEE